MKIKASTSDTPVIDDGLKWEDLKPGHYRPIHKSTRRCVGDVRIIVIDDGVRLYVNFKEGRVEVPASGWSGGLYEFVALPNESVTITFTN